jgi:uncharacterized membrane protein
MCPDLDPRTMGVSIPRVITGSQRMTTPITATPSPLARLILGASTIAAGLSAGVFYAYQTSVTGGLGRVSDEDYVAAFQSINRVIINPRFAAVFAGTPLLMLATVASHRQAPATVRRFLIAGFALQATSLAITFAGNIPLNDALDRLGSVTGPEATAGRAAFEDPWNRYHLLRTVASTASFAVFAIAAVRRV